MPADAIEVGRILDAWGIKGWFKVLPHSAASEALFSSKRWFLQPPEANAARGFDAFSGTRALPSREAKEHSDSVVATARGRGRPQRRRGPARRAHLRAALQLSRHAGKDEYYWVDLIGLDVVNREGVALGMVRDLMSTGPQFGAGDRIHRAGRQDRWNA